MINFLFFFLFLAAQNDNVYSEMLDKGQPAPFAGILFTPEAATQILVKHRGDMQQLKVDLEYSKQVEIAEIQLKLDQTKILFDEQKEKNELLQRENERIVEESKANLLWGIVVPVTAGVATIVLITVAGVLVSLH
jgi:hypothetical protein